MGEKIENTIINDIDDVCVKQGENSVDSELVPYSCYYNDKTIITKNGELLQTVKIRSFVTNPSKESFYTLRDDLNETFRKNTKTDNLSFWFQVVRKPVDVVPQNQEYDNYTAKIVMEKWNNYYGWNSQFANEIYITIVISPEENKVSKSINFIKAINFSLLKKTKLKEFARAEEILSNTTNAILRDLSKYGAKLLKIVNIDGIYYSEHLKFFSLVVNSERKNIKLPISDLSESLVRKKIAYGKNLIQIFDKNSSSYSAIISLKYCNNIMLSQLDKIIQLNQEMIVTQSVSFVDKKQINDEMMEYFKILMLNEDPIVLNLSEVSTMLPKDKNEDDRICISQILIQLKADTKDKLNDNIKGLFKTLWKLGIVAIREEMFMPTLFWSQLPANFNFVKRFQKISVENVCNYTSLFNFPTGKLTNNYWGDSLIVLKSAINTPYFFSFHSEKNGNTLFIGPKSLKKTKYMNLFVMSALKQAKRVFYIDNTHRSKIFVNSMGGKYYFITRQNTKRKLLINPFKMKNSKDDLDFILNWLYQIIKKSDDGMVKMGENNTILEQEWGKLKEIIRNKIGEINKIGDVFDIVQKENFRSIAAPLKKWVSPTGYGFIFNEDSTLDLFEDNIVGIELNAIVNNEELKIAIFDYITYNIIKHSTGEPSVLAIDEGWILFDNEYFGRKMTELLKKMYDKNIAVVMTTSGSDSYETSNIKESVKNIFPTQILLPNVKVTVYQRKIFNISEEESRMLSIMKESTGNIMLKHNNNVIISSVNFGFLSPEEQNIFLSNNVTANIMTKAKELINSNEPKHWLPLMCLIIQEYNKAKFEQKLREQEKRQIQWEEAKQSGGNSVVLKSGS
ncbi:MAG: hypothetical protein LBS34_00185 [Rickettsiales bacterium]|nr:hypothetical protein [Rickettsiales bacterium]